MSRHALTLLTDGRGPRCEEGTCKEEARPKPSFFGVPNDAELEPSGGVPHRLGGATPLGGVKLRF
jgi:hypothetical protein